MVSSSSSNSFGVYSGRPALSAASSDAGLLIASAPPSAADCKNFLRFILVSSEHDSLMPAGCFPNRGTKQAREHTSPCRRQRWVALQTERRGRKESGKLVQYY